MDDDSITTLEPSAAARPRWRRVVDFPLVSLVIALAVLIAAFAGVNAVLHMVARGLRTELIDPLAALCTVAVTIVICKLVIARLGEERHDDLPFDRRALDAPRG